MRAGAYEGGRLPPEEELARDLGVSRATVRAALQSLAEDGIVSRRRRHGTVVNEHMLTRNLPLNRLVSFRDLIEQSGYAASVDPLRRRETSPSSASDCSAARTVARLTPRSRASSSSGGSRPPS